MNHQTINHLNTFYNIIIREHVADPLINSEWNYFMSVLQSAQKDRIDMYLNILTSEQSRKNKSKSSSQQNYNYSKYSPFKNNPSQNDNNKSIKQFQIGTFSKKSSQENHMKGGRNNYLNQNRFDDGNLQQVNFQLNKRYSEPPCRIFSNIQYVGDSGKDNFRQRERSQGLQKYSENKQNPSIFSNEYNQSYKFIERSTTSSKKGNYHEDSIKTKQKFKQKHRNLFNKAQNLVRVFERNCQKLR